MQALCTERTPRSPRPQEGLSPNISYSYCFCPWNLEWVGPRQTHGQEQSGWSKAPPRKVKPDLEVSKGLGLGQKKVWGQRAPLIQRLLFPADVNIHRKLIWAGPKVSVIASDQIGRTHTEAGRRAPCQWCLRRTGLLQDGRLGGHPRAVPTLSSGSRTSGPAPDAAPGDGE